MNLGTLLRGFKPSTFELHVTLRGSGTVTITPPDLVCVDECRPIYSNGSVVQLIAAPAEDSVFTGWSGDIQSSNLACTATMDAAKKIVANFSQITQVKRIGVFLDHGDGTVSDTRTGLMWKRFAEGQRQQDDAPTSYSFGVAMTLGQKFAGYDNWRLPTVEELQEIACYSKSNESFLDVSPRYIYGGAIFWTSSRSEVATIRGMLAGVWCVNLFSGKSFSTVLSGHCLVQLVRSAGPVIAEVTCVDPILSEIASQRIAPENATEWSGIGFEYLLREVECADEPSVILIKGLTKHPEIVSRSIGRLNRTLLHHAAAHHKLETVKYLCDEFHADINSADKDGETPLDYALATKATSVVDYLRALGAKTHKEAIEAKPNMDRSFDKGVILKIETVGGGEVVVSPKRDSYELGARVAIVVTPSTGWRFKGWSGYLNSNTQKCLIVMDTDKQITAHFELLSKPIFLDQQLENIAGTEKNLSFTAENVASVSPEIDTNTFDLSEILQRLGALEAGLSDVLLRLAKLEAAPPELLKNTENIALTVTSLSQVLAWLVTQERVPLAGLRERLLPLDQFPGAFIDEINEKALDLVGDLALEEVGDEIIVTKEVCVKVIETLE